MRAMASYQDMLDGITAKMRDLVIRIRAAVAKQDQTAIDALKVEYRALSAQAAALRQAISTGEAPSALMLQLDKLSDSLIHAGQAIGEDVGGGLKGAATTLKLLPVFLGLALVAVLVGLWRGSLSYKRGG